MPVLPLPSPEVAYEPVPGGGVLLDLRSEVYFGLNRLGARVWELLPPARATEEEVVRDLLAAHPGVDGETVRADVRSLLGDLAGHGLVGDPSGPTERPA